MVFALFAFGPTLSCSTSSSEPTYCPICWPNYRKSIEYDPNDAHLVRMLNDLCEQFFKRYNIAWNYEYDQYQYGKMPPLMRDGENCTIRDTPISEEYVMNIFVYDEIDGANILGYEFCWTPHQNHSFGALYGNLLYDKGFIFPLATYPSVWKDGVIYPTLKEAYDSGAIPSYAITEEYWYSLPQWWYKKNNDTYSSSRTEDQRSETRNALI